MTFGHSSSASHSNEVLPTSKDNRVALSNESVILSAESPNQIVILSAASRGSLRDAKSRDLRLSLPLSALAAVALCLSASIAFASPDLPHIPSVHGTTFSDAKVDLPEALHGKVGILVVGFSQGSRDAVTTWGKKLATDYYDSTTVEYYEMPVLASVPRLLRGFVEGRIKASVSDRGRPHFLPLLDDEAAWRSLVHYNNPDDAYILLVDARGEILWQTEGPPTEATYALLKQRVEAIHPK